MPPDQFYMEIIIKGEGASPKLIFDRREALLPVVPLNIDAKCVFRVINDGYENITLKHRILEELGNINLSVRFPEGKNLGITKNRLKVEVT